jgi:hypothetical protein
VSQCPTTASRFANAVDQTSVVRPPSRIIVIHHQSVPEWPRREGISRIGTNKDTGLRRQTLQSKLRRVLAHRMLASPSGQGPIAPNQLVRESAHVCEPPLDDCFHEVRHVRQRAAGLQD